MSRRLVQALIVVAALSAVARAAPADSNRALVLAATADVDAEARAEIPNLGCPALALGVVTRDGLVWSQGYGSRNLDANEPVDARTLFRIGSLTKPVTALAAMQLRDGERLDLDAPASRYLPELARLNSGDGKSPVITTRELLSHDSGLPRDGDFRYSRREGPNAAEVLAALDRIRLASVPGTKSSYSNLGYALLGLEIGRVSGVPYRDYVTRHVLQSLGMSSSGWDLASAPRSRIATGYALVDGREQPGPSWPMGAAEAMGGLYSDVEDLARLMTFELSSSLPDAAPESVVLRRKSLRETQTNQFGGLGFDWGVFTTNAGGSRLSHTGQTGHYSAAMTLMPKLGIGVVALCSFNGADQGLNRLTHHALARIADALEGPTTPLPPLVAHAMRDVSDRLAHPEESEWNRMFSPSYLAQVKIDGVRAFFTRTAASSGACGAPRGLSTKNAREATLLLPCEHVSWIVRLRLAPEAPNLIDTLWFDALVSRD